MIKRTYNDFIDDLVQSIVDIAEFTRNMNFQTFENDKKTVNAVIRSLEVLGEAAGKLPKKITEVYPSIPWSKIVGLRNMLIHEYFGIDLEIIWETVQNDLLPLKLQLLEIKKSETMETITEMCKGIKS